VKLRIGRSLILAIVIEALAILALVGLVALFGPSDPEAAQAYAQRLGYWVGPTAGFVLCVAGGWLIARQLPARHVLNGLVLGALVAAIDVVLLLVSRAEFQLIFVFANLGRLVAGAVGGWLASRTQKRGT
jgi:hypothetical protein